MVGFFFRAKRLQHSFKAGSRGNSGAHLYGAARTNNLIPTQGCENTMTQSDLGKIHAEDFLSNKIDRLRKINDRLGKEQFLDDRIALESEKEDLLNQLRGFVDVTLKRISPIP